MEKEILIDEIYNFYSDCRLFRNPFIDENQIKDNINTKLDDVEFVEDVYSIIFIEAKERNILKTDRIINMLMALNKIRIELE